MVSRTRSEGSRSVTRRAAAEWAGARRDDDRTAAQCLRTQGSELPRCDCTPILRGRAGPSTVPAMPSSEAKIVWILSGDESYGVRRAVLNLSAEMRRRDFTTSFVLLRGGPFSAELKSTGAVVSVLGVPPAPAVTS